jgi:hypothetical protein
MGKVRVANNKKVAMDEGLLIDSAGRPTTDPGVMYNTPYGAILPFGLRTHLAKVGGSIAKQSPRFAHHSDPCIMPTSFKSGRPITE